MNESAFILIYLGMFFFRSYLSHLLYNTGRKKKRTFLTFKLFDFEHVMYEFQCMLTLFWINWRKGNKSLIIIHNLLTIGNVILIIVGERFIK